MELEEVEKIATDICLKQGYHAPQLIVCGSGYSSMIILEDFPRHILKKSKKCQRRLLEW